MNLWKILKVNEHEFHEKRKDGVFWMCADDVLKIFEVISFCRLPSSWRPAKEQIGETRHSILVCQK